MNQPFPPGHPGQRQPSAGPGHRPPAMPGTYLRNPSPQQYSGPGPRRPMPPRPMHGPGPGPYGPATPPMPGIPAPRPPVDGRVPQQAQQWPGQQWPGQQGPGQQGNGYWPVDTAPGLLLRPLPGPPPGAPRVRRSKKWIGWVVALLVLAGLGGAGYWFIGRTAPAAAAVGDCVAERGTNDVAVVPCGDPSAAFRVVGRLEERTMIDASLFACTPFPDATSSYWQGKEGVGELGLVLCLAPVT
ncbi:LppU/SCO3897 family protein [Pseudonocardia sp. TRM90224]|uniref:LppU/SCO3897 family protein n=1 Tax=Pseudonocardia sp. TRM90224 TaxID=2812678 RepID=UPI001E656296|nr:hypothetical protein [Pseudonocardia sp. TRM90224]